MLSVKDLVVVVELVGLLEKSSRVHLLNYVDLHVVQLGQHLRQHMA